MTEPCPPTFTFLSPSPPISQCSIIQPHNLITHTRPPPHPSRARLRRLRANPLHLIIVRKRNLAVFTFLLALSLDPNSILSLVLSTC
jgi:hypothetical protein